jgi:nicotinate-nucleotide adenylyltransferase
MVKTGLFFGSFNPIHNGHLAIANYLVDFTEVDEVWFVVSPQNPLKDKNTLAPDYHRLEMVKRAISIDEHRMSVCDIEMNMPIPSYTIDTLKVLESKYPERSFYLILGADSLETITKWKDYKDLLNNYKILVYPREGCNIDELVNAYPVKIVNAPLFNFSSTQVREKIEKGEDVSKLIPSGVLKYIAKEGLYRTK